MFFHGRPKVRRILALIFCCLFGLAGGALYFLDARMKSGAGWGYVPENSLCTVAVPDVAATWRAWENLPTAQAAHAQLSQQLYTVTQALENSLGIRPTPSRMGACFGKRTLFAIMRDGENGTHWGISVRPGVLLRGAHILNRVLGASPVGDVFQFRAWHYAYRDGFLIASENQGYVMLALAVAEQAAHHEVQAPNVHISWAGEYAGALEIQMEPGLPFSGEMRAEIPALPASLPLWKVSHSSPDAILSVSGAAPLDILDYALQEGEIWHSAMVPPLNEMSGEWIEAWFDTGALEEMGFDAFAFTLQNIQTTKLVPTPDFTLSVHSAAPQQTHPLLPFFKSPMHIPYAWGENPGVLLPFAGPLWTFALQGKDYAWHCSNQESEMARFLAQNADTQQKRENIPADFHLRINWARFGESVDSLSIFATEEELLPWNTQELQGITSPWIAFLKSCGSFELWAESLNGHVLLRGNLDQQEHSP